MSGPSPETAALRMRSSWTPQSTTSTSTLMPVFSVNGASAASMSSFGCGPLGMIHSFTVVPGVVFAAWSCVAVLWLEPPSSPPQPAYTRAPTRTAAIASAIAYLLRTILLLLLQKRFWS
jgi:hypothetical protein